MSGAVQYPDQDDLDALQELMARVNEPEDRIEKVVRAAAVDVEFYNEMRDLYQQRAAQVAMKDAYYPYTDLRGEFMLGTDLDGRPVGVTRRQLNEHMLVVGRSGPGRGVVGEKVVEKHDEICQGRVVDVGVNIGVFHAGADNGGEQDKQECKFGAGTERIHEHADEQEQPRAKNGFRMEVEDDACDGGGYEDGEHELTERQLAEAVTE